jgi:uncharacterized protein
MSFILGHLPDVFATILGMVCLAVALTHWRCRPGIRWTVLGLGWGALCVGLLLRSARVTQMLPVPVSDTLRLISFLVLILSLGAMATTLMVRVVPRPTPDHSPARRRFLRAARGAVLASPVIATGYGIFVQRDNFRIREAEVKIPGLDPQLHGLRIVQLSDIHLSPFLSESELARAIDMANEARAHVAVVTGDLITSYRDPLDACLRQVARLRADGGVLGCMGNHEAYAGAEDYATREGARLGIRFLRNESALLHFNGRAVNFAGVDYQRMGSVYLNDAEKHVWPGIPNILLSHNPDVFPVAARKGFGLTLAGHTHGGQITFEILNQNVSIARFYTPYVYGLYEEGNASAFVTRGIGTVGVPARLGAPPEVALIRLCAT